jgi:hypothetical protein
MQRYRTIAVCLVCLSFMACARQAPEPPKVMRYQGDPNCDAAQQDMLVLANKPRTCRPSYCYLERQKTDQVAPVIGLVQTVPCPEKASP